MKNKRRVILAIAGLVLIGGIAGGTLAYFTDNKTAVNTITMGDVAIDLEEPRYEAENPNREVTNITPNQSIDKDPTITLQGDSENAYIRAKIEIIGDGFTLPAGYSDELEANINIQNGWVKSGEYYYYNEILTQEKSIQLFDKVRIPETWGGEMANKSIKVNVTAEAIQADNFTPTRNADGMITGWFMSDGITPITPDNYNQ